MGSISLISYDDSGRAIASLNIEHVILGRNIADKSQYLGHDEVDDGICVVK